MKISKDDEILRGLAARARPVGPTPLEAGSRRGEAGRLPADRVELSDQARALYVAKAALAELPLIRQDKIASLKQRIQNGTYRIPGEKIAQRMLAEDLFA